MIHNIIAIYPIVLEFGRPLSPSLSRESALNPNGEKSMTKNYFIYAINNFSVIFDENRKRTERYKDGRTHRQG